MTAETMRKYLDVSTETGRENRKNFNRKRVLRHVRLHGTVPLRSTMTRYTISPVEVNIALTEGGYEARGVWDDIGNIQPRFTGSIVSHNEEQQRLLDEFEGKASANILRDQERRTKAFEDMLSRKHQGHFLETQAEHVHSTKAFFQYFWKEKYVIDSHTGALAGDRTIAEIFGAEDTKKPGKTGRLYLAFKKYSKRDCLDNVVLCIEHLDEIIDGMLSDNSISLSVKKGYLNAIYVLMTQYERYREPDEQEIKGYFMQKYPEQFKLLTEAFKKITEKIDREERGRKETELLQQDWDTIMKRAEITFGNSNIFDDIKAYLYFKLYDEFPSRDDLGELLVNPKIPVGNPRAEKKMNYIFKRGNSKTWTIVLNHYKTSRNFGRIEQELSVSLSKLIDKYMKHPDFGDQEYLMMKRFSRNGMIEKQARKQSTEVNAWLKRANILGKGAINILRHTITTVRWKEEYDPEMPSEELKKLAYTMRHSPIMSKKYTRKFASEFATEESIAKDNVEYGNDEITSNLLPKELVEATKMITRSQARK